MKSFSLFRSLRAGLAFAATALVAIAADSTATSPFATNASISDYPPAAFAAIGSAFAQSSRLPELGWDEVQIEAFVEGVRGALHGKNYPFDETARRVSAEMGRRVHELETHGHEHVASSPAPAQPGQLEHFMKEIRKHLRLQQTDSGLAYNIIPGHGGLRPRPEDMVVISCTATAADGKTELPQLTSDHVRVKMTDLLPGFLEALQMMTVDSKAMLVLPPALSFGDGEWPPGVDKGAPLLFQITLHEVISTDAVP